MKGPSFHEIMQREIKMAGRKKASSAVPSRPMAVSVSQTVNPAMITTSDDVPEGVTNLYFTDARAYAAAKAILQEGAGIDLVADDESLTITITALLPVSQAYFFYNEAGDNSCLKMQLAQSTNPLQTLTIEGVVHEQELLCFITNPGKPGLDFISEGAHRLFIKARNTKIGSGDVRLQWKLSKWDGVDETVVMTSGYSNTLTADIANIFAASYYNEEIPLALTDRLIIRIYAEVTGGGTAPDVALYVEGNSDARYQMPTSIAGLNNIYIRKPAGAVQGDILYHDGENWTRLRNNYNAVAAPTSADDETLGYAIGSRWVYDGHDYTCVVPTEANAVWVQDDGGGGGAGDVVGPGSAVDSNFAAFDTITGKLIKDSGSSAADFSDIAHTHGQLHDRQHSVTSGDDHTFPGGGTTFLRDDGTFVVPSAPSLQNLLINGGMDFIQRQAPTTATSRADGAYGPDRWYVLTQTNGVNVTKVAGLTNTQYAVQITQAQAAAQRFGLAQVIEANNSIPIRSNAMVFCGRVKCSASTNLKMAILEWTGTADAPTKDVVKDWTSGTYTANNFFLTSNLTVTAVGTQAMTAATETSFSITGTPSSSANNIYVVIWTESTQAQNVTLVFTAADFYPGTVARSWCPRPVGEELALCLRYCYVPPTWNTYRIEAYRMGTPFIRGGFITFPSRMFASPTVSHNISAWAAASPTGTQAAFFNAMTSLYTTISGALTVTFYAPSEDRALIGFTAVTSFDGTSGDHGSILFGSDVRIIYEAEVGV